MFNNYFFIIQIVEKNILFIDNFMVYFYLLLFYVEMMEMLKGIFIFMFNLNLLIVRKMFLYRVGNFSFLDDFN